LLEQDYRLQESARLELSPIMIEGHRAQRPGDTGDQETSDDEPRINPEDPPAEEIAETSAPTPALGDEKPTDREEPVHGE
jgi:hypothetical protein